MRIKHQHLLHVSEQEDGQSLQKRRNTTQTYSKSLGRKLRVFNETAATIDSDGQVAVTNFEPNLEDEA